MEVCDDVIVYAGPSTNRGYFIRQMDESIVSKLVSATYSKSIGNSTLSPKLIAAVYQGKPQTANSLDN